MKKIKTVQLTDNLFLNLVDVKPDIQLANLPIEQSTSYIFLIDRSGSMYGHLNTLIDDLQRVVSRMKINDLFSFGYFSTEGVYDFPVKGFKISKEEDKSSIQNALEKHRHTIGLTCFSEILGKTNDVLSDLKFFADRQAVWLLTDGYPIVNDLTKEEKAIEEATCRIGQAADLVCLVGYGDYYNVELLERMSRKSGAILTHANHIDRVSSLLMSFLERATKLQPKLTVEIKDEHFVVDHPVLCIDDGEINTVQQTYESSTISAAIKTTGNFPRLAYFSSKADQSAVMEDSYEAYAIASYGLSLLGLNDEAINALGKTKDVYVFNALLNSFTVSEVGNARELICNCVFDESLRFQKGKKDYLMMDMSSPCVIDLLDFLTSREDVRLHPKHQEFKYKSIGGSPKPEPGYPKFLYETDSVPISNLVWHSELLNLNIQCTYKGHIRLPEKGRRAHNLPEVYPTSIIRNYTIIRNGALAVNCLPISMEEGTYKELKSSFPDLFDELAPWSAGAVVPLDLSSLPLVNCKLVENNRSAILAFDAQVELIKIMARTKVLRQYLKDLEPFSLEDDLLTPEQEDYLKTLGVSKWGYNPPTEKTKVVDELEFYSFEFAAKTRGFGSIPSFKDAYKAYESKKPTTGTKGWMVDAIETYESKTLNWTEAARIIYLKTELENLRKLSRALRLTVDRCRLAIVLGRRWFNDLDPDQTEMEVQGITIQAQLKTKKQPVSIPIHSSETNNKLGA